MAVETGKAGKTIRLSGQATLRFQTVTVPGDISSAAFPLIAGLIVPGSQVEVADVGLNPTRTGLVDAIRALGGDIAVSPSDAEGEPVGSVAVRAGTLRATVLDPALAPRMIDEYPALMVAAAFADGETEMRGLKELRVKESDRLAVMAEGLSACGVPVRLHSDGISITGTGGGPVPGGATIASRLDHRIAMSFAILGLHARAPVVVDDARPIDTSFPDFVTLMQRLGASDGQRDEEGKTAEIG
ncbi:MAG: hypothetical protein AAGD40_10130 [Pseudomonadota bacterium]